MKTKILLTILTIAILSSPLFAQRDSLCMRMIDTWDIDTGTTYTMLAGDDFLLGTVNSDIYICSLDSTGALTSDSLMFQNCLNRKGDIFIHDTLLFLTYWVWPDCSYHIYNIADILEPIFLTDIGALYGTPYFYVAQDTMLLIMNWGLKFSIADLDSIYTIEATELGGIYNHSYSYNSYPYAYRLGIGNDGTTDASYWFFVIEYWSDCDTIFEAYFDTLRVESYPHSNRGSRGNTGQDTILYTSIRGSRDNPNDSSLISTIVINSDRDSAWIESEMNDFHHFMDVTSIGDIWIYDSLLIMVDQNAINIFNISNPLLPEEIAYYYNEEYIFRTPILRDSLLYINYNRGDTAGIATFEYPCTTCDGNCELEREIPNELNIDVYPNPFNSICQIELPDFREPSQLRILDINGNTIVDKKIESDMKIYPWNAKDLPSGVYLITLINGQTTITRKVFLIK